MECEKCGLAGHARKKDSTAASTSPPGHALRVDVERIERVARRHEQAVAVAPAETQVGAALRQPDVPDRLACGIENPHAVELAGHAPAAPEVAVDVDTEAVRRIARHARD